MSRGVPEAARMETDVMRDRLEALLDFCRKYDANPSDRTYDLPITSDVRARLPAAQKIIEKIDPNLIGKDFGLDEGDIGY